MVNEQKDLAIDDELSPAQRPTSKTEIYLTVAASLALGVTAGVPYISPAYDAAGDNPVLGTFFSTSTVIVFGATSTWGWNHILNEMLQRYHSNQASPTSIEIKKATASFLLAACSGAISFYVVHKYNNSIIYPILTTVNNFGLDSSGYYKLMGYAIEKKNQNTQLALAQEPYRQKFFQKMIMVFPVGNLVLNSYLSYRAGEVVVDNAIAAAPFSLLALSTFALDVFGAYELVQQFYAENDRAVMPTQQQLLIKRLMQLLSLTLVLFSTSSRAFIAEDSFGDNAGGYLLAALSIGSGLIFGQYVLSDLANRGLMLFNRCGSNSGHALIQEEPAIQEDVLQEVLPPETNYLLLRN